MDVEFIIVGQGLAGSALAVELLRRGARILVVDRQDPGSSSRVAAGLVTPLTGKGINPAWRQEAYLPAAEAFYRELERETGGKLYHTADVVRILGSEKERAKWRKKSTRLSRWGREAAVTAAGVRAPFGAIRMSGGGWLDTGKFLTVVKKMLLARGAFRAADFNEADVVFSSGGVVWQGVEAAKVILCQGAYGLGRGGWFGGLPHRCAKGEILTLEVGGLADHVRYHADGWLAPRGHGLWKAGATYDWDELDSEPTAEGRAAVLRKVESWCACPLKILAHEAGVRPIIRGSRPAAGLHPEHRQVGFFNGLGSKGSLMAPGVAAYFADYLTGVCALDPELDVPFSHPGGSDGGLKTVACHHLLQTAHQLVRTAVRAGDTVIDATVGNGHDTLFLASQVGREGEVIGFDVQRQAIDATRRRLDAEGLRATLHQLTHARMADVVAPHVAGKVACVMFNLGYLPGSDKSVVTRAEGTLEALSRASSLLRPGGVLTVMCYPGHPGGGTEADAVEACMRSWQAGGHWGVTRYQRQSHRSDSPFLLAAVRKTKPPGITGG